MPQLPPMTGVDIPAIDHKVKADSGPPHPGGGTPWEDRGSIGLIKGFVYTCTGTIRQAPTLFASIRRLETQVDANSFTLACGILWSLVILWHGGFELLLVQWQAHRSKGSAVELEVSAWLFMRPWIVGAVLAPLVVYLVVRIVSRLFQGMAATELRIKSPPILVHNVFAYAMGPSLLALVPRIGPPVAVLWIGVVMVLGAMTRLRVSFKGALTACIISYLSCVLAISGIWFVVAVVWKRVAIDPVTKVVNAERNKIRIRTR